MRFRLFDSYYLSEKVYDEVMRLQQWLTDEVSASAFYEWLHESEGSEVGNHTVMSVNRTEIILARDTERQHLSWSAIGEMNGRVCVGYEGVRVEFKHSAPGNDPDILASLLSEYFGSSWPDVWRPRPVVVLPHVVTASGVATMNWWASGGDNKVWEVLVFPDEAIQLFDDLLSIIVQKREEAASL